VGRRRSNKPPDLTSLFDVLFLFVFVALVNAGAARKAADDAEAKAATPPPAPVRTDLIGLRDRALARLGERTEAVARVSRAGALVAVELPARTIAIGAALVEPVADPDVGVAYVGERDPALHLCRRIATAIGAADLHDYLVIVAPEVARAELTVALASGLTRDADRCLIEDRGVAVVLDPAALAPAPAVPPSPAKGTP
jgi:hypothetical protein